MAKSEAPETADSYTTQKGQTTKNAKLKEFDGLKKVTLYIEILSSLPHI